MDKEVIIQQANELKNIMFSTFKHDGSEESRLALLTATYSMFMDTLGIPLDHNSRDTAYRFAKMMLTEKCSSLYSIPPELTVFPNKSTDEYVVIKDIPFTSICSHHHVTFFGKAHIAYFPQGHILGLSKFGRVVQYFAAKPQIQEEMTAEIANYLNDMIKPVGLVVKLEAEHLCMSTRGVKISGSTTVTQKIIGVIDKTEVMELFK